MDNNNNNNNKDWGERKKGQYHELINFAIQGMSEKYLFVVESAETTMTKEIVDLLVLFAEQNSSILQYSYSTESY